MKLLKLTYYEGTRHRANYRNASVCYYIHNRLPPVLDARRYTQEAYETTQTT